MSQNREEHPGDSVDSLGERQSHADARGGDSGGPVTYPDSRPGADTVDNQRTQYRPPRQIIMTDTEFQSKDYDMKHKYTGRAMVINNKTFQGLKRNNKQKIRKGSDKDRDAICQVLKQLGFIGVRHRNPISGQIHEQMVFEDVQKQNLIQLFKDAGNDDLNDYTDMDCFVCIILSYGEPGAVYCPGTPGPNHEDDVVELKQLQDPLKGNHCRTLVMKPKLFFVQGCPYAEKDIADAKGKEDVFVKAATKKIPIEADFLTQSCHLRGSYGWDHNKTSWFIRALCKALQKFCIDDVKTSVERKSIHFMTVLTRVNRYVADFMEEDSGVTPDSKFQIPLVTSLLTKHLYFCNKGISA